MPPKESAAEKPGFLSRWRDQFSRILRRKKVVREPEKEAEPDNKKQTVTMAQIVELPPSEKTRLDPVERHAKRVARRAEKKRQLMEKQGVSSDRRPDEMAELLEKIGDEEFEAALEEKEADMDDGAKSIHKILLQYPVKPERKLDLHGLKAVEAESEIDSFIRTVHERGLKTVEIITGKGTHSKDSRSVLRDVAEEKIVDLKKHGLILHFKWENLRKTKSGVLIVYLK
ncbi:Smr/MutS family protein [Patescibacteria group bacterium]|nr:Smr/MutS family protein [Patescibacteria group bacterium]